MAFKRRKTKRLGWRISPPDLGALRKEKADAQKEAPPKRPTITDILVTKERPA